MKAKSKSREKVKRIKPFVIVKPEGGLYLPELERTLNRNKLSVSEIFAIKNWAATARIVYAPQLKAANRAFNVGFETHLWLSRHLFGNNALLIVLDSQNGRENLRTQVQTVLELRNQFRNKFSESNKGTFFVAVNLERLPGEAFKGAGIKGQLGVLTEEASFSQFVGTHSDGRWDDHYFKYIHAPDTISALEYEWGALLKLGILTKEAKITKQEWGLLKLLRSTTPPSIYKEGGDNRV